MIYFVTAESQTRSVPLLGEKNRSARCPISCLRKSNTYSFWPNNFCARLILDAITGCDSAVLDPIVMTISAAAISSIEPESPPYPTVRNSPLVAGDWQYREQLSTLFVPIICRANFCIKYDSSFVAFDEAINPSASGPFSSLIVLYCSASSLNDLSHFTSSFWSLLRISGLFNRLSELT